MPIDGHEALFLKHPELRFRVVLTEGEREVGFERVAVKQSQVGLSGKFTPDLFGWHHDDDSKRTS